MALQLDLTGTLASNLVMNETHNVSLMVNRYVVLDKGAFFGEGLVLRNQANGELLRPIVDYSLYEPVQEIWKRTGKSVYKIIHVSNPLIAGITVTYQALGGDYQYTAEQLALEISNLIAGGSGTYPFGHVSDMPTGGLAPETHPEDGQEIYDAGKVVLALNHIADVIENGDRLALGHVINYANNVADEYYEKAVEEVNAINTRLDEFRATLDEGIGDIIITDNETPPNVRKGYGQFALNPDVLLIGANEASEVGQLVGLQSGSDVYARRTFIFTQVEDLGQITYLMTASATNINEGSSVTFTLTTTGLTTGTKVPYRITGTTGFSAGDISGSGLTGNFVLDSNGVGIITITAIADSSTEANESFTCRINANTSVYRTVRINDTSKSPTVSVRFSAASNGSGTITSANEGTTAYLVITGTNMPSNHEVDVVYGGSAQPSDFQGTRPSTITLDNSGTTIVPFVILADATTDGNRTLIPTISSDVITTSVSTSLNIIDSSKTPTYDIWFSTDSAGNNRVTSLDESTSAYVFLHVKTANLAANSLLSLGIRGNAVRSGSVNGGAADYDITGDSAVVSTAGIKSSANHEVLNGILKVNTSNKAVLTPSGVSGQNIRIKADADFLSEGSESITIDLLPHVSGYATGASYPTALRTATLTVNDTSQDPSIDVGFYTNASGTGSKLTAVNEGSSFYLVIKTSNVPSGTVYNVAYSGSTTSSSDFSTTLPTKLTVGTSGTASAAFTLKNDYMTEGAERLQVQMNRQNGTLAGSATLNINDTSVNSTATGSWHSNTAGNAPISTINEGKTAYLHFVGSNMPSGAAIKLTYPSGSGLTNASDFTTTLPSQVALNSSGRGYATYTLKNDLGLEGDETLRVVATYNGSSIGTFELDVVDTSVPTMAVSYSASSTGSGTITSTNEGSTFYVVLQGAGFANGNSFNLEYSGVPTADFETTPPSSATINSSQKAIVKLVLKNNMKTDGNRTLKVTVKRNGTTLRSANITVNDTSKTPTYALSWSPSSSGSPTLSNLPDNSPDPIYLIATTTNLPDYTQLVVRKNATHDYSYDNYYDPLPDSFIMTVVGNRATYAVNLRRLNPGTAHLGLLRTGGSQGTNALGFVKAGVTMYYHVYLANNASSIGPSDSFSLEIPATTNTRYVKPDEMPSVAQTFNFNNNKYKSFNLGKLSQAAIDRGAKYVRIRLFRTSGNATVLQVDVPVSDVAY